MDKQDIKLYIFRCISNHHFSEFDYNLTEHLSFKIMLEDSNTTLWEIFEDTLDSEALAEHLQSLFNSLCNGVLDD